MPITNASWIACPSSSYLVTSAGSTDGDIERTAPWWSSVGLEDGVLFCLEQDLGTAAGIYGIGDGSGHGWPAGLE